MSLREALPPPGADPVAVVEAFSEWAAVTGRPLYDHQEAALLAMAADLHVVLATPTGSGKSMAALAGIALARNRGERCVWTAPIKALVGEKFFELVDLLGPSEVGLAIGDASINREAPILVCTAEVLANMALGSGDDAQVRFACLDEFHYYAETDRGWAWQIPLLLLKQCQFLLASATLGDMSAIAEDLVRRTGRGVEAVTSVERPTPLYHGWRMTPVAETVVEAVQKGLSPVYVVHSTQLAAIDQAQAFVSLPLTTRPQREAIADALKGERLTTGFGSALARYLRNGVGVHHAGMLPRYRRLVERLAGQGLLPVICGTDTLGVGVNIPIRTVLLRALTKFDGSRVRTLRAREFHQLAGRAGRPGFDPDGYVWAQAPDHVIENERALARAGDDPKARRKVHRAAPPKGFVHYDAQTFERLVSSPPESLVSRFRVTPDLVVAVLSRPDGIAALKDLLLSNHDPLPKRRDHIRRAIAIYRSLEAAGVASRVRDERGRCISVRIGSEIAGSDDTLDVRFTSPLGPFAIEVVATFDHEAAGYELDVVSVIESIMEDPRVILIAQEKAARGEAIAQMKADGIEYDERIELVQLITWPKPLDDVLQACFATYRENHPWLFDGPSPKSIVREMLETGETFRGFVGRYKIERSEGVLLRYLTDVWRALDRSLSSSAYTDGLEDIVDWLRQLISATDASLLEEWERLSGAVPGERAAPERPAIAGPPRAWRTAVRTAAFGWVELVARRAYGVLSERTSVDRSTIATAMAGYWAEHDSMATDADARSSVFFELHESPGRWVIRQRFADPAGDGDWGFRAFVDLAAAEADGGPTLVLESLGRFGEEHVVPAAR